MNRANKRRQKKLVKKTAKAKGDAPGYNLQALFQDGLQAHQAGRLADAEAAYRRVLGLDADHADANHLLGVITHQAGDHGTAVELIGKAIQYNPAAAEYHCNLGNAIKGLGRLEDAVDSYNKAISLNPDMAIAHNNLGNTLQELRQLDQAVASFRKALHIDPEYAEAHSNLAETFREQGLFDEAVASCHKSLAINPNFAEAHGNLGAALHGMKRLDEAIASYEKALAINPNLAKAENNLGGVFFELGKLDEAVASYHKALAITPDYAEAVMNLGMALSGLGRMDEAVSTYHKAISLKPDYTRAYSNLLITMQFMSNFKGADLFETAQRAGAVFEAPFGDRKTIRHANDPEPERRLRIGYLSPSLSEHVLAPYLEPVFKAHRRDKVSVHVYAHVPNPDGITWRLKELADSWTFVHGLSDEEVAALVVKDSIDILVDPMGHWGENRLLVFARKPAPIQVSYLCQGLTTGLPSMDYTIGDRWLNFDGAMQSIATEKVVELASGFQVVSCNKKTPIDDIPFETNGFITFSSFNNPAKISDASLRLWASILDALPTARLLIKGKWLDRSEKRLPLTSRLTDHGIPIKRVDMQGLIPGPDHLAAHNKTDIALDTTPFTGGQTTVDALWMGVPVVTLIGDTVYGRFSYSHVCRAGVMELAAHSETEFVEVATTLADDPDRLRHYRQTLRPALRESSLLDASLHVTELEDAFRVMWRRWCDGLEPEAFAGFDKSDP
jgi:protein O-GlcNAc transferase